MSSFDRRVSCLIKINCVDTCVFVYITVCWGGSVAGWSWSKINKWDVVEKKHDDKVGGERMRKRKPNMIQCDY